MAHTACRAPTNMRIRQGGAFNEEAALYASWILQLGSGTLPPAPGQLDPTVIELPRSLCMPASPALLIAWTFPSLPLEYNDYAWLAERCILAAKNAEVDAINEQCLQLIPTTQWVCYSADAIVDADNQVVVPPEYLHTLTPSRLQPHKLLMKKGAPVMLLRNLNSENLTAICPI